MDPSTTQLESTTSGRLNKMEGKIEGVENQLVDLKRIEFFELE